MTLNCIQWWGSGSGALWEYGVTSSLPLLPGPLWLGVVVPDNILSIYKIDLSKNDVFLTGILDTI